jgi:F-type H+-transporting ATPase subunit delta
VAEREDLIRGYAEALFTIADAEGETAAVEEQLYAFAGLLDRDAKVRDALADPALPAENKEGLIRDILGERANPVAASLLGLIVRLEHGRDAGRIAEALVAYGAERRQHQLAEVRSAIPLDEARRAKLAAALSKATGRTIEVKVVVDPSVIGGVVARLGDEVFDGTVRSRLREARHRLAGGV